MLHSLTRAKLALLPPGPFLVPSILITSLCGSLLPPGKFRSLSVTATLAYLVTLVVRNPTGEVMNDTLLPIQALILLIQWVDQYLLHFPEKEFWKVEGVKVKDESAEGGTAAIGWKEQLKWGFGLKSTLRGVGWNWQVKNIPTDSVKTKWQFVRVQAVKAFVFYFIFDFMNFTARTFMNVETAGKSLFADTLLRQAIFGWIAALESYYGLNQQYAFFAGATVAFGLYAQKDWPPLMGRLRDVSTVRDMWGKFWHQCLRRSLSVPYEGLTRIIPFAHGTMLSRYGQLYLAFIASGLLHQFPIWSASLRTGQMGYGQLTYFLLQPLAITSEDLVVHLGKKIGVKKSWKTKILGTVWLFVWFSFSLRYAASGLYTSGYIGKQKLPSLCNLLAGLFGRLSGSGIPARMKEL